MALISVSLENYAPVRNLQASTGGFPSDMVCGNKFYRCSPRRSFGNPLNSGWFNHIKDVDRPAVGFQYDTGAAWAVVCKGTEHGNVPGKRDNRGGVYYPWGGKERRCNDFEVVYGELVYFTSPIPADCPARGYQNDTKKNLYNAVIVSKHGMVPGKANLDLSWAWYPWGSKEHGVTDQFYIIC